MGERPRQRWGCLHTRSRIGRCRWRSPGRWHGRGWERGGRCRVGKSLASVSDRRRPASDRHPLDETSASGEHDGHVGRVGRSELTRLERLQLEGRFTWCRHRESAASNGTVTAAPVVGLRYRPTNADNADASSVMTGRTVAGFEAAAFFTIAAMSGPPSRSASTLAGARLAASISSVANAASTNAMFLLRMPKLSAPAAPFDPRDSRNSATSGCAPRSAKSIGREP